MSTFRRLCRPLNIALALLLMGVFSLIYSPSLVQEAGEAYTTSKALVKEKAPPMPHLPCWKDYKSSSVSWGNPAPRIAMLTFTTVETSYTHLSLANKNEYARKHNYDLIVDYEVPKDSDLENPVWHKLTMFEQAAATGKYDWLWWIDFDTVITNTTVKLEDVISESLLGRQKEKDIDFLLTADCFPLNAGSMLLRVSPLLTNLISSTRHCHRTDSSKNEQDCIRDLLHGTELGRKHALFIPQTKINSFPKEIPCYDSHSVAWSVGDFVVHFAGAWAHLEGYRDPTGMLMRKYAEYVDTTEYRKGYAPEPEKARGEEVMVGEKHREEMEKKKWKPHDMNKEEAESEEEEKGKGKGKQEDDGGR